MKNFFCAMTICIPCGYWPVSANATFIDQERMEFAKDLIASCPEIAKFQHLASNAESQLTYYAIHFQANVPSTRRIYIGAAFHGDEGVTADAALALIAFVCNNQHHARVQRMLRQVSIIVQPVVNPFGLRHGSRKGMAGIDPNRDFPIPSKFQKTSFSGIESRIVDDLLTAHPAIASLALHSGTEAVFYPNGFTRNPPPQQLRLRTIAGNLASILGITRISASSEDYLSFGEFSDYMLHLRGALSLTVEISKFKNPINTYVREKILEQSVKGMMNFIETFTH